jgi:hypothetical protein
LDFLYAFSRLIYVVEPFLLIKKHAEDIVEWKNKTTSALSILVTLNSLNCSKEEDKQVFIWVLWYDMLTTAVLALVAISFFNQYIRESTRYSYTLSWRSYWLAHIFANHYRISKYQKLAEISRKETIGRAREALVDIGLATVFPVAIPFLAYDRHY